MARRKLPYIVAALLAFLFAFVTANAAFACVSIDDVAKQLEARYQEKPAAGAITAGGGFLQLFSTEDGSSWTLVVTMPGGCAHLLAAGEYWEQAQKGEDV